MCDTAEVVVDETKGLIAGSEGVTNLYQNQPTCIVVLSKFQADLSSKRGHGGDAKKFRDFALDELS